MRILLIAPTFFGYRERVEAELARMGHLVDCVDDRPSEGGAFKSLAKIGYGLVGGMIGRHAGRLRQRAAETNYDLVLYMGGMSFCFTREQFEAVRKASKARFVAYLWDSLKNCRRFGECLDLFDDVYSFEPEDCRRFNLKLRPLFYSDAYAKIPPMPDGGFEYDACFIGSVHQPSKFRAVAAICEDLESRGLRVFKYFYMPSLPAESLRKATDSAYRGIRFQRRALSPEQVARAYSSSKSVIDSPQAGQSGLTMRTLEAVGARRKLITSNADAGDYDIAAHRNVALWSSPGCIPTSFFDVPYVELAPDSYKSYSVRSFAETLLGEGSGYHGYKKGTL